MRKSWMWVAAVGLCLTAGRVHADDVGIVSCEPVGDMTPHCGFRNPEDLKKVPDRDLLVVSEMGSMFEPQVAGALSLFDLRTSQRVDLPTDLGSGGENWGDAACAPPPLLNPHGIDLSVRPDGRLALFVVNHGGREAVEIFELVDAGNRLQAKWRGCAIPPGEPFLNDVVALPEGGFATTHMWDHGNTMVGMGIRILFGMDTGFVWEWTPEGGFEKLEGTDATMPNGITSTHDGRFLYVDNYLESETVRFDRRKGAIIGSIEIPQPDNVTVDREGRLWIAAHHQSITNTECVGIEGACPWKYSIVRVDPETMEGEVVLEHEGAPMGMATVALPVGERLYLGSAIGDRIVSMPLPGN